MENSATPLQPTVINNDAWSIPGLFSRALSRLGERIINLVIGAFVSGVLVVLAYLAFLLLIGATALVFGLTKAWIATIVVGAVLLIPGYFGLILVYSWIGLAFLLVIKEDPKVSFFTHLKTAAPITWGIFWYNVLFSLFIIGLLYLGVVTLMIVPYLWMIWGMFAGFVYLDQKKKGLDNLWISRTMVNQRFWGIVGRMILLFVVYIGVMILLAVLKNPVISLFSSLLSLFFTPFLLSYVYEMYKNVSVPAEVKKPTVWIWLSVVGWVLVVLFFVLLGSRIPGIINNASKYQHQRDIQKQMQQRKLLEHGES